MPAWLVPAAMGLGSLLGGIFGRPKPPKPQNMPFSEDQRFSNFSDFGNFGQQYGRSQTDQSGRSTTRGQSRFNENFASTTNPFITEQFAPTVGLLQDVLNRRLLSGGLPEGYETGGIRAINQTFDMGNRALANRLASSGTLGSFGTSPDVGAAQANMGARLGQIADFRGNLPLVARELQNQDLAAAQGLSEAFGRGEQTRGTRSGVTDTSSVTDSIMSALTNSMGVNMNQGYSDQSGESHRSGMNSQLVPGQQSAAGAGLSSLMPWLMYLYGNGRFGG